MSAALTVATISRDGLIPTLVAADTTGNQFTNDGRVFLYVQNTAAADRTVTVVTQNTVDGLAVGDKNIVVTTTSIRLIGPFPTSIYNDATGGVQLTYATSAGILVAPVKLIPTE